MMGRFEMDEFLTLLEQHAVTSLYTVPPVLVGLAQYPGVKDHDLSALRYLLIGAAPLSEELQLHVLQFVDVPTMVTVPPTIAA